MYKNEPNNSKTTTRQAPRLMHSLLSLFSIALLSCIIGSVAFYLYFSVNNSISTYQQRMNGAAYSAQQFFDQRESLLRSMVSSSVHISTLSSVSSYALELAKDMEASVYPLPEQNTGSTLGVILTQRDLTKFAQKQTHLIYTSKQSQKTTSVLPSSSGTVPQLEENQAWLWQQLSERDWKTDANGFAPIIWLNSPKENDDQLFIYTPVDPGHPDSGWLGITFSGLSSEIALSTFQEGNYVLVDSEGIPASYGNHTDIKSSWTVNRFTTDSFGFVGKGVLPEYLELKKSVGVAGWSLVYYVPLSQLINKNMPVLQATIIFGLILIVLVILCIRYLHRRVLAPALEQFVALVDSEALNRKLVATAPVGLGLVRRRDAALLLSNELVQAWIQSDRDWFNRISTDPRQFAGHELKLNDGRTVQLSCTSANYGGESVILCVISDITGLKVIEGSLVEAKRIAESASQAKTLFLTTMNHEIRTPLYGVLGTLELLSLGGMSDQQREYLKTLQYSSSSLLRIVNDSLDLSSIEAGQLTLENVSFSPMELVERVVTAYAARAESKNLNIYAVCDSEIPPLVMGDELRVRQILDNLVNNAVKFTHSGHVVLRLQVTAHCENSVHLNFQVADTGTGIAPAHLPHLFEPYFKTDEMHTQSIQGSGLGLSICSRLAEMMGGQLKVISELELGTHITLSVSFPLSEDLDPVSPPKLLPYPVYVEGAIPEVVSNICNWLRYWGAQAQPYRGGILRGSDSAIMVKAWPQPLHTSDLPCKHIVALPLSLSLDNAESNDVRVVSAYSVASIGRAVQAIQQGAQVQNISNLADMPEKLYLRLLIVDDNPISLLVLREQLNVLGCEAVTATNGHEALNIPNISTFDAVLTDLNMPIMDGYSFAQELRNRGFNRPIIGLTGNAYPDEYLQGHVCGINTLIRKPQSLMQLSIMLYSIKNHRL